MAIPNPADLYLPILTEMSKENRAFSPRELADTLKPELGVTESDMNVKRKRDNYSVYYVNGHKALLKLKRYGLIKRQRHGYYILTAEGHALLAKSPKSFKDFMNNLKRQ